MHNFSSVQIMMCLSFLLLVGISIACSLRKKMNKDPEVICFKDHCASIYFSGKYSALELMNCKTDIYSISLGDNRDTSTS